MIPPIIKAMTIILILTQPFLYATLKQDNMNSKHINNNIETTKEFNQYVKQHINKTNNTKEMSKRIAKFVRKELYANTTKPKNHDVLDSIHLKEEMPATCSGYARLTTATANALGLNARVIWTQGHTISEIYYENQGWTVVDSTGDLMYNKSITNIHAEDTPIILTGIKGNDENYLNRLHKYEDNPVIVMIDTEYLNNFAKRTKEPKTLIKHLIQREPIATGYQYTENRIKLGNILK